MSKTRFENGTVVTTAFAQSIYGQGANGGHRHDGVDADGHCAKIDESQISDGLIARIASESFIGDIRMYAGKYPPLGFRFCDGSTLENTDEYADYRAWCRAEREDLYVGNIFSVPDMRGVFPLSTSAKFPLGANGGSETHTLTVEELAPHTHSVHSHWSSDHNDGGKQERLYKGNDDARETGKTPDADSAQPHNNMPPYIAVNFIIRVTR